MSFDFYAEFWDEDKINSFIKDFMRSTWEDIWQDRSIDFERKKKEFQKRMINNLLNELYRDFVGVERKDSIVTYAKFLKEMETYLGPRIEDLNRFAKSELRRKRGKKEYIPQISNEIVKETHKENLKEYSTIRDIESLLSVGILNYKISDSPPYSVHISVVFTLKKPYISRDDEEFHIIDNPICNDKVFKVPLVRPSSWKGNLRFAALKGFEEDIFDEKINETNWKEERAVLVRLFGSEKDKMSSYIDELISKCIYRNEKSSKDVEEEFEKYLVDKGYVGKEGTRQGRLVFYPTFLDKIDLDVITPLKRDTRTPARGPITFEVAPGRRVDERGEIKKGAKGSFFLFYFPFDLGAEGEKRVKKEVKEDLEILKDAIPKMLTEYGFGAKTTAGYGIIENEVEFQILPKMERKEKDEKFGFEGSKFEEEMNKLIKSLGEDNEQRN